MALNPQLYANGMAVPFENELFVLARDGVEFEVDKIPGFVFLFLLTNVLQFYFILFFISFEILMKSIFLKGITNGLCWF